MRMREGAAEIAKEAFQEQAANEAGKNYQSLLERFGGSRTAKGLIGAMTLLTAEACGGASFKKGDFFESTLGNYNLDVGLYAAPDTAGVETEEQRERGVELGGSLSAG